MNEKLMFARLNNQNYQIWKTRMEMLLKHGGLWSAIDGVKPEPVTTAWTNTDQRALAAISLYVEDSQLSLVKAAVSAKDAWNKVKTFHDKATMTSRVSLLRRICSLNMEEGADMEKHLYELEELFDRLDCAGQKMEVPLKVAMVYRSLPESYHSLVTALESRPDKDQTLELVKQKLLDEHQRRAERAGNSEEKALQTKRRRGPRTCWYCEKPGHIRENCRLWLQEKDKTGDDSETVNSSKLGKKKEAKAKQAAERDQPICFGIGVGPRKGWCVDSGCSSHMTNDREFFSKLDESVRPDVVLANGAVTPSAGVGEGTVRCVDGKGHVNDFLLKEVLYIPDLEGGLLSVRMLTKKGLKVNFSDTKCNVSSGGEVVAVAELIGNLYVLRVAESVNVSLEAGHLVNCQHTWHRRLGHRDLAALERIAAEDLGANFKVQDCGIRQVCEHCLEGKLAKSPLPKAAQNRAERVLDLVHTDVCGPMTNTTPGGSRYMMTLVDDFSRYTVVCLLSKKSDAANCIKRYVAHVQALFGRKPIVIQADGGREYLNRELKEFYESEGIKSQSTAAYSPKQSGVAERKNRTLLEIANCMLLDSGLEKKYWGEAIMTAGYLQNRLPSRSVDRTPFEKWFGRKPSLGYLRVFGSPAYVRIPGVKRSKLDSKGENLIFVGYCDDQKAWRFLNTETDRITISPNARFVELRNGSLLLGGPVLESNEDPVEIGDENGEGGIQEEPQSPEVPQVEEESDWESADDTLNDNDDEPEPADPQAPVEGQQRAVRSTRGVLPGYLDDYVVDVAVAVEREPVSFGKTVNEPEEDIWRAAMADKYESLLRRFLKELEQLSRDFKHIDTKDLCDKGVVMQQHCSSACVAADILTVPLGNIKQKQFKAAMGLVE